MYIRYDAFTLRLILLRTLLSTYPLQPTPPLLYLFYLVCNFLRILCLLSYNLQCLVFVLLVCLSLDLRLLLL